MKRSVTVLLMILACVCAWALPTLSDLFPNFTEAQMEKLLSGGTIEALTSKGKSVAALAPAGSQGYDLAVKSDNLESGFAIAGVSYVPYPDNFLGITEKDREVVIYNIIRSISTQKGITYISHLAGEKPVTLFEDSYLISNPDKTSSKIADPVSTEVPESYSCYSYQKDNRFGKNVYTVNYTIKNGDFLMDISNYTKMKYMGFSCVPVGDLHMDLEIIECEEGFVLYTLATVYDRKPQVQILFITVDLPSAFMRRITAIKDWFVDRVNLV